MNEVLAVLTINQIAASIIAGLFAGLYTEWFFGRLLKALRPDERAVITGAYWALLGSLLFVVRIMFSIARQLFEPSAAPDAPRFVGGWLLFLLFAVFVGLGVYVVARIKNRGR